MKFSFLGTRDIFSKIFAFEEELFNSIYTLMRP